MTECSFGITGKDFVLLASDQSAGRSIIKMKSDENKIRQLSPSLCMAYGGEPGDTENFVDFVERNLRLYQIRHNIELAPGPASAYIRKILAEAIRSRRPYAVNVLLGGFDKIQDESHLYWMDPYGTKVKVPYTAGGLGIYVALSTMDKYWYPDITREEAGHLLKRCIDEVKLRLAYQFSFNAVEIDKEGVREYKLDGAA